MTTGVGLQMYQVLKGDISETQSQEQPSQPEKNAEGSTLSFHDLRYEVDIKTSMRPCAPKKNRLILQGINGFFAEGMNAIMGPTGGGKSSLLDILAGRKDPKGLTGTVLVDGRKQPKNFKCMSGYVVQEDIVMGTLTVRENLMVSANLRLPESISHEEKTRMVDTVLSELKLHACANTKVGTQFIRGVSGGEKKRTSIGMELIISPSVLFLDEPTTGLDSNTANSVMGLLHDLSRKGRTIIFSIHQPRYSIYRLFDRLMLLGRGKTVYHGPAMETLNFLSSIGYTCDAFNSPADFFLDVVNGDEVSSKAEEKNGAAKTTGEQDGEMSVVRMEDAAESPEVLAQKLRAITDNLSEEYHKSNWYSDVKENLDTIYKGYKEKDGSKNGAERGDFATSFFTQFRVLLRRATLNLWRNPQASFMQFGVIVLFSLIVGVVYFDLDTEFPSAVQNRVGAFFFITMSMIFSNLAAVELFMNERVLFVHENVSGFYRTSSYFLSKLVADLLPMRTLPIIVYSLISYFMIGLREDASRFFIYMLNLWLTTLTSCGVAFFASASVNIFAVANLCQALTFVIMMIFGGLLINVEDIADWLSWLQWVSIFRYSLNTLTINELKDMEMCTYENNMTLCSTDFANEYLEAQGIDYETSWQLWRNPFALACMIIILFTGAYIQLRRVKKLK